MEGFDCLMEKKFIAGKEILYNGLQLKSHWIYQNFDIIGDAVVGFIGGANVSLGEMVDLLDVKNVAPIYSTKMLHFIVEHFHVSMETIVLKQRLFICILQNNLNKCLKGLFVERYGDDLFYNGAKLSVSIATISPVSGLIHIGLNIDSKDTPVKTAGLISEMKIESVEALADQCMKDYILEMSQIAHAGYKVRSVP